MTTSSSIKRGTSLRSVFESVQRASRSLALESESRINALLTGLAAETEKNMQLLLSENKKDLDRMDPSDPRYDRLKLTEQRIKDIASDIRNVTGLPSPLAKILDERTLPNGLELKKVTVPLGVIGIIYEARPNVTFDVFSLCLKSGNACILKGGSDALYSNEAIIKLIKSVVKKHSFDPFIAELLPAEREATEELLNAVQFVDIIIPRGSQKLIDYVRQNAKVPVIETGAGIVHAYVDESASLEKAKAVVNNSKTRRVSVCNALDCLLVHKSRVQDLPALLAPMVAHKVTVYADNNSYRALSGKYPAELLQHAEPEHYGTEFLSYKMSVKTVDSLDEAMDHIARYSSRHSEVILSEDKNNIEKFFRGVDAAVVYANTSTAFTDGAQFGLGAEIGISTQKLHARGPMALAELTSYKWLIKGEGQVRP